MNVEDIDMTMNTEIQTMINHTIQKLPTPEQVTLVHVYDDGMYGDVENNNEETIKYTPLIGGRTIGNNGILIYLDNDYEQPIAIIDTYNQEEEEET